MENRLRGIGTTLASEINQRQASVTGLAALARLHGNAGSMHREFPIYASGLQTTDPVIRAIQVYPMDGAVLAFPPEDSAQIAGRTLNDLIHDERHGVRADVQRTIASRAITVSTPYELRQGGKGMAVRLAVHRGDELWGLVVVVLDLEPFLDRAGVFAASSDLHLAIRDGDGQVFHGDADTFTDRAVLLQTPVADRSWTLAGLPQHGLMVGVGNQLNLFRLAALMVVLVLGGTTWLIASRQTSLELTVQARTHELNQREQDYRLLFEQSANGIFIVDEQGRCLQVNPSGCALLGYTRDEILGLNWNSLVVASDPTHAPLHIEKIRAGRTVVSEHRVRRKDGDVIEVEISARILPDGRTQAIARDITESKRISASLKKSEALLRIAGRTARLGGWMVDLDADRVVWSEEVAAIHEVSPGYAPTLADALAYYAPEWRDRMRDVFGACTVEGRSYDEEMEIITARGRRVWVRTIGEAVRDDLGCIIRVQGAFQDISERKQTAAEREELLARERTARAAADAAAENVTQILQRISDGFASLDRNWRYTFVNEKLAQMVGRNRTELIGRHIWTEFPEAIDTPVFHAYQQSMAEQRVIDLEHFYAPFSRWFLHRFYPSPGGLSVFSRDITERKAAEEALRQSEARYRALIEHAPLAIFINRDDRVVLANQACVHLFGATTADALIGRSPFELFHPDNHAGIRERIRRLRVDGEPVPLVEERIVRLDGSVIDVEVNAAPFVDQGTHAIHVVLRDITERRQGELERRRAYELLTKLAAQVPGVVYQYLLLPDGRSCFPYASPGLRAIYECEPDEVREDATPIFGRLHPEDRERIMADIKSSAQTLAPFHCEFRVVLPRQGLRWRLSDAIPERTSDGGTLWHGIISDITDRKVTEQALRASVDEKEALLREVHHRVKNNLQVITSLLRLQAARAEGSGAREVLAEMQARIRSMALLHETLHRSDNLARVDLAAYVESICRHMLRAAGRTETGGIQTILELQHVHVTAEQAAPCGLIANELLSNAMKHAFPAGRTGQIRVALRQAEADQRIVLEVSDDGVGLPENFAELREHSLGLQLVSDLSKQLDGTLHVAQGPGTMFTLSFPPHGTD